MHHFSTSSLAVSFRPYLQRILFAALACLACMLIYAERTQKDWVQNLRHGVMELASPLAQLVESPAKAIESAGDTWTHFWKTHAHNKQLRFENAQLLQWQAAALKLEAENASLRELLSYQPSVAANYTTAKAIGASVGSLSQRLQLNAGLADGLRRHLPVINKQGLIGRLLHVSPNRSEVLLLTDMRSRIPVILQPSGLRALLVGDHHDLPYLKLADNDAVPPLGESIFTSSDGDVMPAGLFVGKLFAARDKKLQVRPAFQASGIDMVRIVNTPAVTQPR